MAVIIINPVVGTVIVVGMAVYTVFVINAVVIFSVVGFAVLVRNDDVVIVDVVILFVDIGVVVFTS